MTEDHSETVPRPPEEPKPDQVYDVMAPGRCYVVADLVETFEDEHDPGRWTMRRRLETLHEEGRIVKYDHANDSVTYQRPFEGENSG